MFILGDALEVLPSLERVSVDSIVTSPPYADARSDVTHVDLEHYAAWTREWAGAALPVVRSNLLLNLGRRWVGGLQSAYHIWALNACIEAGWHWVDEIIWSKPNANPLGSSHLVNAHEYVYWLARDPKTCYRGYDEVRTPYKPESVARLSRKWDRHTAVKGHTRPRAGKMHPLGARPRSVVEFTTGKEKGNPHPAPMPLDLADWLVRLSTPPGGTVLCPFGGSGTVGLAAQRTGRDAVIIEIEERWLDVARERCAQ
jgi:site-specific DNA-methyltransferase (adenine-specific)